LRQVTYLKGAGGIIVDAGNPRPAGPSRGGEEVRSGASHLPYAGTSGSGPVAVKF
jgi:hypothetical protein